MAKSIVLSEEYSWTASYGLFEWVLEFLCSVSRDQTTTKELQEVVEYNLPGIDVAGMPDARRREILRALSERLIPAAESSHGLGGPESERRFIIGHLKVLKLMSDEVSGVTTANKPEHAVESSRKRINGDGLTPQRQTGMAPGRIILSDEYRWSAAPELFDWVVRFMSSNVRDPSTRAQINSAISEGPHDIDLANLSNNGRSELLRALREGLTTAAESTPLSVPQAARRSAIGHIKVLKLMAEDMARATAEDQ